MRLARRVVCLVRGHETRNSIQFTPGDGVAVTVTSAKATCVRCGSLVQTVACRS